MKPGWRAAFPDQSAIGAAKNQWLLALMEAGISDWSVIEGGLAELRQSAGPFLPSTGDFIEMCGLRKLSQLDVPSEQEAFRQLQRFMGPRETNRDFSRLHPAVYAAYKKLDWSVMAQKSDDKQRRLFSDAWMQVCRDIKAGRELPKYIPQNRSIGPVRTMHQRKVNPQAYLDNLKSLFADEETPAEHA
ncbi:replication protein P [Microbulbifer sp. 2304DJ12-6]|uniref:replication protein P n=1 Tax=Microbulbifer sp. 2304DJ12-6 TaxID=3233340 RepID=UPI0039AEB32E